jgi:hypothetical protein
VVDPRIALNIVRWSIEKRNDFREGEDFIVDEDWYEVDLHFAGKTWRWSSACSG